LQSLEIGLYILLNARHLDHADEAVIIQRRTVGARQEEDDERRG